MITTTEVLSKFSKDLQDEYNELEKKIDLALTKYNGQSIWINCSPSQRVKDKIIKDYSAGGWKVSSYSDQIDGSGLKFDIHVESKFYYDDYSSK